MYQHEWLPTPTPAGYRLCSPAEQGQATYAPLLIEGLSHYAGATVLVLIVPRSTATFAIKALMSCRGIQSSPVPELRHTGIRGVDLAR